MIRDKVFMSVSTFVRMGTGLIVFILLARFLGPEQFGIIATAMAYSGLIVIASDFGLGTYALRLAGAEPSKAAQIVARAIITKAAVTLVLAAIAGAVLWLWTSNPTLRLVHTVVFAGLVAASFADLGFAATRANSRYDIEAWVVVSTSAVWLGVLGAVAAITKDVVWSAIAFAATRLLYLMITTWALRVWVRAASWLSYSWNELCAELRQASSYALDSVMTNLSNQADILMISFLMVHAEVGIYQAGARLVQGISPFGVILSTVYLPKLSAALKTDNRVEFARLAKSLNLEMLAVGIVGFLGFLFVGPFWTRYVYGLQYAPLEAMWPGFAAFVLLRFVFAAYGIQLAAMGEIRTRIGAQFVAVLSVVVVAFAILPLRILPLASWILVPGSLVPLVLYGRRCSRLAGNSTMIRLSVGGISLVVAILFSYVLWRQSPWLLAPAPR